MRSDRRRRRAWANTRREWCPLPDDPPSLSAWRHDRQALNRLITASPDPFSLQDDSQVLTREQSPGASPLLQAGRLSNRFCAPPGVKTPAPAAFSNRGIVAKMKSFRFFQYLPTSAPVCVRLSNGFQTVLRSRSRSRSPSFGLYEAAPLHSVSRFGVCGKSYGAERREELRYDEGRRKGVGSEGRMRPDVDPVTRFRGFPGLAGESPDDRFPFSR